MPNQPATFNKTVRVEQKLWEHAGAVAAAQSTTRAAVVNAFLRWYVGELDAQLPTPATRKETDHA
jgi:ferritin